MSNKFERNGQDVPGLKFCYVPQSRKIRNVNANWSSFYADVSHRTKNNGEAKNTTIRFLNWQNELTRWTRTAFYKRMCVYPESYFSNRSHEFQQHKFTDKYLEKISRFVYLF